MRSIDSNALAVLATNLGTEPINIVEIQWNVPKTGTPTIIQYADKDITDPATGATIQGKILDISGLDNIIDILGGSTSSSISITLDDTDDSIRQLLNKFDIHKKTVTVYQWFPNLNFSDRFVVYTGYVVSPLSWSEGERTFKFDVLAGVYSRDVGFTPEQGQFFFVPIELIGNVWPLGFGDVVHQRAVKFEQVLRGATMRMFMLPDLTLPLKLWFLQYASRNLITSYQYYQQTIAMALGLVDAPLVQQQEYINLIIDEDGTKQEREDLVQVVENLNNQIKQLIDGYNEDPVANAGNIGTLNTVKQTRDYQLASLKSHSQHIADIKYDKYLIERGAKNAKYQYNVVGKLRAALAKVISQYVQVQNQIMQINVMILDEVALNTQTIAVTNGYRFPQNTQQNIDINGQVFGGTFSGNVFTYNAVLPTYQGILVGPKVDTNLNTFYVTNPNLALANTYALTNVGIIKITGQQSLKCTFELREIPSQLRTIKNRWIKNPDRINIIQSQLGGLLIGDETPDELLLIASSFPTDISNAAWSQLSNNGYTTQTITMSGVTAGTWFLYYDNFSSPPLPWNATANQVQVALSTVLQLVFEQFSTTQNIQINPNITVTGGPLPNNNITITFNTPLLPMKPLRADGNNLTSTPDTQVIYETGHAQSGGFQLTCDNAYIANNGKLVHSYNNFFIAYNDTAATIAQKIANKTPYTSSDISVSGGPLNANPVVITYINPNPNVSIYLNPGSSTMKGTQNPSVIVTEMISPTSAMVGTFVQTVGAHEHTLGEINKMIQNALGKSQFRKALEDTKKNLQDLWNQIWQSNIADDQALLDQIAKYQKEFRQINAMLEIPQSVLAEAYRLISDKEYGVLFDFEMLNFLNMVRAMTPIQDQIPDPHSNYYFTGRDIFELIQVAPTILPDWLAQIQAFINTANGQGTQDQILQATQEAIDLIQQLPETQAFFCQVGSPVAQFGNNYEQFIINQAPSTVFAVYAHRNINGVRYLVPVPKRYYSIANVNFGLFTGTTITLVKPLSYYVAESWEEDLYVSYRSSISSNTADVIQYIYQTYTTATIDSTSFAHVHSRLANYPMNFSITSSKNALQAVEEIAFQARCATWLDNGVAFIKYLAENPTTVDTITESDIEEGTLTVTTGNTEDLVTKFIAQWKPDQSLQEPFELILRRNIPLYQEIVDKYDFYCYNIYSLVEKSATFWLIRKANAWKKVTFTTALHKLNLEVYDYININLQNNLFCTGSTVALIEKAEYNSESRTITFTCWTPVRLGQMTADTFSFPADLSAATLYPVFNDVIAGNVGNPLGVQVPTGLNFDPNTLALSTIRPYDWGSKNPSDANDQLPQSPLNEFAEVDYTDFDPEPFDLVDLEDMSDTTVAETSNAAETEVAKEENPSIEDIGSDSKGGRGGGQNVFMGIVKGPGSDPLGASSSGQAGINTLNGNTLVLTSNIGNQIAVGTSININTDILVPGITVNGINVVNGVSVLTLAASFGPHSGGTISFTPANSGTPDGGDPATSIAKQFYQVTLMDGRVVNVQQLQIHPDDTIQNGTAVIVVFEPTKQQFFMQVPVWQGEYNVG